jgi:hypothetical protein
VRAKSLTRPAQDEISTWLFFWCACVWVKWSTGVVKMAGGEWNCCLAFGGYAPHREAHISPALFAIANLQGSRCVKNQS